MCSDQCFGDPVDAGTGNKFETRVEFAGEGVFPLRFSWTYNRNGMPANAVRADRIMGRNRSHTYLRRVSVYALDDVATAYLARPDGRAYRFNQSDSQWLADSNTPGTLTALMSDDGQFRTGWKYLGETGETELFDVDGNIRSITNISGYTQIIEHDSSGRLETVIDPVGRQLRFVYGEKGLLARLALPDGSEIGFSYSSDEDLERVTYADGTSIQYRYDEAQQVAVTGNRGRLTGVIDESGGRYSTTRYDSYDRVSEVYQGESVDRNAATYTRSTDGSYATQSQVTLPSGAVRQSSFKVVHGSVVPTRVATTCSDCVADATNYTYDANGRKSAESRSGVTTQYEYSSDGRLLQRIEAADNTAGHKRTTRTDWHADFRVPTERRVYDAANALIERTSWTYNARGQVLAEVEADLDGGPSRTITMQYCEQAQVDSGQCPLPGLLLSVDGPRTDITDTTTFVYYAEDAADCVSNPHGCAYHKGDLWKTVNALGQATEILRYDGAGRVVSTQDANGLVADREYHARGWLTAYVLRGVTGGDHAVRIDHEPTGLVKRIIQADGSHVDFSYDAAHRLIRIADSLGNYIAYTLDGSGNRLNEATYDSGGTLRRELSRIYDGLGRMRTLADADANPIDYDFDGKGHVTGITDALGRITARYYDPLDRLTRTLQDVAGIRAETRFGYDGSDRLTQVTDPNGLSTGYQYDRLGNLIRLTSPDTGITTYGYDLVGNRISQMDARGHMVTYRYDALNRMVAVDYPTSNLNIAYQYDSAASGCTVDERYAIGRLSRMQDDSGSTEYCYDRFGQLTRKRQVTNGKVLELRYGYDAAGRLAWRQYPDGSLVDYAYDSLGRIATVGATVNGVRSILVSGVGYAPFGPVTGWTYGNGRQLLRQLDDNYRPVSILDEADGGLSPGFGYDPTWQITELRDGESNASLANYDYDTLKRLHRVRDGNTVLERYGYDATGNRIELENGSGLSVYDYIGGSHRLSSDGSAVRQYDAAGNTLSINFDQGQLQFIYNDAGRMQQAKRMRQGSSVAVADYSYNGTGEQVRRTANGDDRYSLYDETGRWIGDYDNSGLAIQQAIWLDDIPVGLLAGNGTSSKLYHVQPDHLGTPRAVVDPVRNVAVWNWELKGEAFGTTPPDQDPDNDGTAFVFDMRYPGQRYDNISGLHYNYFRDYEPGTGRYVQSDPIGLEGGMSTYAYTSGNPINRIDPLGLTDWVGTSLEYSVGRYLGGTYTLSNICTGQGEDRLLVRIQGNSYGFSSLPKKLQVPVSYYGTSNVSFSDSNATPDSSVFNGVYANYSVGFGALVGGAFGKIRLGDAASDWGGSIFWGYQVSAGGAIGQSKFLWSIKLGQCPCDGSE